MDIVTNPTVLAMDQTQPCRCSRPDMREMGKSRFCLSCGLTDLPDTRSSRKSKADEAEIDSGDNKRAAAPMFSRAPFGYAQLKYPSEFRLLRLFPGKKENQLEGEIFHADISHPPAYEAVSYTWGQAELTQDLHTAAGLIKITKNCLSALTGLRHDTFERILWVDAICIAQADDLEKNHQIPLMARIYSRATNVLIYLGSQDTFDTEALFSRLRRDEIEPPYDAISRFLSLPWFSRIWVLQEVAMARHAVVILGSSTLKWRYLSIGNIHAVGLEPTNSAGQVPSVLQISRSDKKPVKDVLSLIAMARSCLSSDPRDRIYALLGLVDDRSGIDLSTDYTKTAKEVYTDVAAQFLRTYNCLDFLSDIGRFHRFSDDGLAPASRMRTVFPPKTEVPPLEALESKLEYMARRLHRAAAKVSHQSDSMSTVSIPLALEGPILEQSWHSLYSLMGKPVEDFISKQTDSMPMKDQYLVNTLHQFQEQVGMLFPVDAVSKQWLQTAAALCESWKSKFEILYTGPDPASERLRLHDAALQGYKILLDPDDLLKPRLIEQESIEMANESLELPTWVPDYEHHPRLSSFTYWKPNTFGNEPIAHLHTSSTGDHTTPFLEVNAALIDKVQRSHCTPMQKIPLCGIEVSFTTDSDPEATGFLSHFTQSLMEIGHGADIFGIRKFSQGRRLALTDTSLAIVPGNFNVGDVIAILNGGTVPYLLRPSPSEPDRFQFIGECYLHGVRGPQFAPNYAELLGWFKHRVMGQGEQDGLPWRTIVLE